MTTSVETVTSTETPRTGHWELDPAHSDLTITARHLMVTKVRGTFDEISGTIDVDEDLTKSKVRVEAKASSVTTGSPDRDEHLRSADFLDSETHPTVTFESTEIVKSGSGWKLTGDLTVRGVTNPITFDLTYEGSATDPWGNEKAAFVAKGAMDREKWGLTWNASLESGGVLVSKRFDIEFDVQATLKSE